MKLGKVIICIGNEFDLLFEMALPFPKLTEDPSLREVGMHYGMYNNSKVTVLMCDQVIQVLFYFIFKYK